MSLFAGRIMAGPMVRVSSLGFREYCAASGADACFTEELVSAKLMKATAEDVVYEHPVDMEAFAQHYESLTTPKSSSTALAMTTSRVREFVVYDSFKKMRKRQVVLAVLLDNDVAKGEGGDGQEIRRSARCPLVVQLGAADPAVAAAAALVVADVADALDVNMGCPKKFSIENGMGAALMQDPTRAGNILAAMHAAVNSDAAKASRGGRQIPISFKTRVFAEVRKSVDQLATVMRVAGGPSVIHAVTLHARTRDQRSETDPLTGHAAEIVKACRQEHPDLFPIDRVAFVVNGSIWSKDEGKVLLDDDKYRGVFQGALISRGCMWDPTVFASNRHKTGGPRLVEESSTSAQQCHIYRRMMLYHFYYQTSFCYLKYHLTRSFQEFLSTKTVLHRQMQMAKTYGEFGAIVGLAEGFCRDVLGDITFETLVAQEEVPPKRPREEE